ASVSGVRALLPFTAAPTSSTIRCNSAATASTSSARTLDVGRWTLDVGCSMFDVGCWKLDSVSRTLDVGLWTLDSLSTLVYRLFTTSATHAKSSCPSTVLILNRR